MNDDPNARALRADPDWYSAAEALIEACVYLPTPEDRVRWLERLCLSLGDALYPAFLHVLCHIGEQGDPGAQKAVADVLVLALQSGRLPSGRHTAWGSVHGAATRTMGPIEYLCAWHAQPGSRGQLNATAFDRAARALLGLVSHSDSARRLYCAKLLADSEDPLDGAWSRSSRQALQAMARAWAAGAQPQRAAEDAVNAFLAGLRQTEGRRAPIMATGGIPPMTLR
ncbi:MAG: hypothetical protein FWG56_06570 [Desulfovibrionaceae bacterium]|nr:hypothetical protein [Desulfovibrionaceae bacterium]